MDDKLIQELRRRLALRMEVPETHLFVSDAELMKTFSNEERFKYLGLDECASA